MPQSRILIIGAGLGGLTAALALLKAGFHVRVFEQSFSLGEVGAGIMVTPNSCRVLTHLGLLPAMETYGVEPEESVYRRFDTAEVMVRAPLRARMTEQYGARYFHIHRADLHNALVEAVRRESPDCITLGKKFARLENKASHVITTFSDGTSATGDALIGCDGIRSAVRATLFGDGAPQFTGQVAWRGLVPADGLPETVTGPVSNAWIGSNRHIIQYRLRGGRIINYVAIVKAAAWTDEGWNRRSEIAEVVEAFADWHPDVVALLRATHPDQCFKWGLFDRDPLAQWSKDRITLLGDAAHPMLPFMAQGSAMAIEDGMVLANAMAAATTPQEGLARYEAARKDRASWVVLQSRAATRTYQNTSGNKDEERARNLDSLYRYDAVNQPV